MHVTSKQLGSKDISGDELNFRIFKHPEFIDLSIEFDRIHYDFKTKNWIIVEHLLIDYMPSQFTELPQHTQNKINNLNLFVKNFEEKTGQKIRLVMDLYFPKNHANENTVIIVKDDIINKPMSISNFSTFLRKSNFYGEEKNSNKNYIGLPLTNDIINSSRQDDSAFSLSQSCLGPDVTYGFNLDKIIFNSVTNEMAVFEYLLCEEAQYVTPYTSHPNRYFKKNAQKFINLFKFSKVVNCPLYLINYAKPGTLHENKALLMEVLSVDENDKIKPINTKNLELTPASLALWVESTFLTNTNNVKLVKNKFF